MPKFQENDALNLAKKTIELEVSAINSLKKTLDKNAE